ncbi:MAG TPA: hypothetical protein VFH48_08985 [Chloroflexota bacterium]|nr:hypothetical protein [Chloroflexota bacterium]
MSRKLGLPPPLILLLAALAVPRVVTHDLGIVAEGSFVNSLLVFVPLLAWLTVALWWRIRYPIATLTAVGVAYGVMLAIGHQVLWDAAWDGEPPRLGGNLTGALNPAVESAVLRVVAVLTSIVTGTLVGAIIGTLAWAIERLRCVATRHVEGGF